MQENQLLHQIYAANEALPDWVTIPPGDDMAALKWPGSTLLVAADQLIDGVHFDLANTPLTLIARKALTRNLSDIAAMAACPVAAVATVALPRGFGQMRAEALSDGLREVAAAFGCPLVGGDIAIHRGPLHLCVTVLARPWDDCDPLTRRGAVAGDRIYVSGSLGYSFPSGHHLTFEPRLDLAHRLAADPATRPRAMVDLSDGLAQDLPRLADHSLLDAAALPLRQTASDTDTNQSVGRASTPDPDEGATPWQHALGDGEDYELLFAAAPDQQIPASIDGVSITNIGSITDAGGHVVVCPDGSRLPLDAVARGWQHEG